MIKMKTAVSGQDYNFSAGELVNIFTDSEEQRFVAADLAEYVNKNASKPSHNQKKKRSKK